MRVLLTVLSSLTIAGSGVTPLANAAHQFSETNNNKVIMIQSTNQKFVTNQIEKKETTSASADLNLESFDYSYSIQSVSAKQFSISQFLEQYLANHPDSELEEDLLNSLSLVNQSIQINFDLIEVYKNDIELYQVLTSSDFIAALNNIYTTGLLTYDVNYKTFSFDDNDFQTESNKHYWREKHWYWFGYYKKHFDHELSEVMADRYDLYGEHIDMARDQVGETLENAFPELGGIVNDVLAGLKVIFTLKASIFEEYDHGKGVWIGYMWGIPNLGWGSNK